MEQTYSKASRRTEKSIFQTLRTVLIIQLCFEPVENKIGAREQFIIWNILKFNDGAAAS